MLPLRKQGDILKVGSLHRWDLSPQEAIVLQNTLRAMVQHQNSFDPTKVKRIAGADVSYSKQDNLLFAVVVVFSFPGLKLLEEKSFTAEATYPYVPGLLAFREGPSLIKAFKSIETVPDLVMFDGQGVSHPRGFGIATHLGVLLDKPSIGVAKTVLVGTYQEPALERGFNTSLLKDGREIGGVVRTRKRVKPVFVSAGHKIDLETAVDFVLKCSTRYRLPEPVRYAHMEANQLRTKTEARSKR